MADTLIGTTEAAKRCGVDRTTFFRWVQLQQIAPVTKLEGRTGALLFDPDAVEALAAEKERRAKHDMCPVCPHATWHFDGAPCPHAEDVAS